MSPFGLVDHHDDRQLGALGGHEPGERRDVVVVAGGVLVAARGRIGLRAVPVLPATV